MAPTFTVNTGVANTTCALYANGLLYGTGVSDEFGAATIAVTEPITTPGDMLLTVFGYNQLTYVQTVQAVVPADIVISPSSIPVGVAR